MAHFLVGGGNTLLVDSGLELRGVGNTGGGGNGEFVIKVIIMDKR